METFLRIGMGLFFLNALRIMWHGLKDGKEFRHYLAEKYPAEFYRLAYEDAFKKTFLWPWRKDTLVYFMFDSKEDFGDPRIAIYRRNVRWAIPAFVMNCLAAMVFFIMVALCHEYIIGR